MAVVKTEQLFWTHGERFDRKIRCGADGVFASNLPHAIVEAGFGKQVEADSLKECGAKWWKVIKVFLSSTMEERRVIHYTFENDFESQWIGVEISISACVLTETKTTVESTATWSYKKAEEVFNDEIVPKGEYRSKLNCLDISTLQPPYNSEEEPDGILPWSEEAEQFFIDIDEAMHRFANRLEELGDKPEYLLAFISKGLPLLPPESTGD